MSENTAKKNNGKKIVIGVAALVIVAIVMLLIYQVAKPSPAQGAKELTIEVVDDNGKSTDYEVHTDAEYLRQAMEETEGLTFEGEESDYGMMVETVNGLTASYDENGAYWAFYVDGEYCDYGIDTQPVEDGQAYSIVYTPSDN